VFKAVLYVHRFRIFIANEPPTQVAWAAWYGYSIGGNPSIEAPEGEIMSSLTMFSARDAKAKFGEVLDTALGQPVGITKHDRLTAYIVSKNVFETMKQTIEALEDQLWLLKADAARQEGFASSDDVGAFLNKLRNSSGEPENHKTSPKVS
jgi:prevent-host-death family protein